MTENPAKRSPNEATAHNRRARAVVKAYVDRVADWNNRVAVLRATLASGRGDREAIRTQGAVFLGEIETAYAEFRAAVADEPPHSRIEDVDQAFRRLLGQLRGWSD